MNARTNKDVFKNISINAVLNNIATEVDKNINKKRVVVLTGAGISK